VLVSPDLGGPSDLEAIVRRVHDSVGRDPSRREHAVPLRVSVGAVLAAERESPASVLRRADAAMYAAKTSRVAAVLPADLTLSRR